MASPIIFLFIHKVKKKYVRFRLHGLQNGSRSNRPQVKSTPDQIIFLFNLIICIVNCVVYLIPNQIIVLLCCLFNLIICP
jgi:hypothetical protein